MSFPAPSVEPPTFTQWPSVYFNGITLGPGPFYLRGDGNFDGMFMPNVRNGDVSAPRIPGSNVGLDLLDVRDITLNIDIGASFGDYSDLPGALAAIRSALTPTGTTENPLFFQLFEDSPMLVAMVRPRKRGGDLDLAAVLAGLMQKVPLQFHATDPTLYAAGTQQATGEAPGHLQGFMFDISFDWSFGGGQAYTTITVTNAGDMPCYPIITFVGACTSPALTNGTQTLQFGLTLGDGDGLVVNTDPKYPSAIYYPYGSETGVDVQYALTQQSQWWALAPETTVDLQFSVEDDEQVNGYCTVAYTSAYSAAS